MGMADSRRPFLPVAVGLLVLLSCSSTAISGEDAPVSSEPSITTVVSTTAGTEAPMTATTEPSTTTTAGSATAGTEAPTVATTEPSTTTTTIPTTTTTTAPPRDCTPSVPPDFRMPSGDPVAGAVALSRVTYACATQVGLAPASDIQAAATLAAAGLDGPLLLVGDWFMSYLMTELRRLAPDTVLVAGLGEDLEQTLFEYDVRFLEVDPDAVLIDPAPGSEEVWLLDPDAAVGPVAILAANLGVGLVVAEPDFRALPAETRQLIAGAGELRLMSYFDPDAAWQLDVVRRGDEIPGGGLLMFGQDFSRRLIAIYGHPVTSALGVLGEQGPEEGVERLAEIASGYDADGALILPTFEIIATVASAGPGRDGDYSGETDRDVIRPWIETAAANDVYVVLDLQPGRTHFLTQAKYYEEFLRLPHVGLALDPEWRLKPNEVHLVQIGTVDAEEINEVVEWLAGIVREEALPQKLLIVHQFRFSMITNRELIETPQELAVVIQMDGQGGLGAKYNTWNVLTKGTEEAGFRWGWKNFYDEDDPTATPEQVLELTPVPVFVSFQ